MTQHQTHASADASRVSTRHGEWSEQMVNLALAELEVGLDSLRPLAATYHISYSERAVLATSLIDGAAERLERLGAS